VLAEIAETTVSYYCQLCWCVIRFIFCELFLWIVRCLMNSVDVHLCNMFGSWWFDITVQVKWQTVLWGIALQFVFALIVLRWTAGYTAFQWLGDRFTEFLAYSDFGAEFVFGKSFRDHFVAFSVSRLFVSCFQQLCNRDYVGLYTNTRRKSNKSSYIHIILSFHIFAK